MHAYYILPIIRSTWHGCTKNIDRHTGKISNVNTEETLKKEKWNSILSITTKLINMDYINLTRILKERRIWQPHLYSFTPPPPPFIIIWSSLPKSILSISLFNPAFAHWYLTSPLSMYISVSICIFWHRKKKSW